MSTFTWTPDIGAEGAHEPRIRAAKFGDGYEQRAQDGLNADMMTWPLSFSGRSAAEAQAIDAFLTAHGGVTAFDWTPPEAGAAQKFICKKWKRRRDSYASQTVTATFEQVPA